MPKMASPRVAYSELRCQKRNKPYPKEWRGERLVKLLSVYENLCSHYGWDKLPIIKAFVSTRLGFLPPETYTRTIPAREEREHLFGRALDIGPPSNTCIEDFHRMVKDYFYSDTRIGGVGFYPWGVHIDIRPYDYKPAIWYNH